MNEIIITDFVTVHRDRKEALDAAYKKLNRRIAAMLIAKAVVIAGTLIIIHKLNQIEN